MDQTSPTSCPICGHAVLRPDQARCSECGLAWDDWVDRHAPRLSMGRSTWLLLLLVLPVVFSVLPLLTARGAVVGARTFEASYLLVIPGFIGILFLSVYYARAVGWRLARRRSGNAAPPSLLWLVIGFLLLLVLQVLVYFLMVRIGFYLFVHPLRPVLPGAG